MILIVHYKYLKPVKNKSLKTKKKDICKLQHHLHELENDDEL